MSSAWRTAEFADIAAEARSSFAALLARPADRRWWTAVVLTASSERQAERYRAEIETRVRAGHLPPGVLWRVVPDIEGRRMGSGAATLHALAELTRDVPGPLDDWWRQNRVFMIHSGGDSRRLPQYSPSGKLFGALPAETAWGETSTVFDETMALSTLWAERMSDGLLVGSGDVLLTFDAAAVAWTREGVTGVGMRQTVEVGSQHGVYVADAAGRVYTFLQKPQFAEVQAAGGILADGSVAVDTGLLRFSPKVAAELTTLGRETLPPLDLYEHFTWMLTGQRAPAAGFERRLADALRDQPFHCDLTRGEFTHIGTTKGFRAIAAGAGGVIDSVLPDGAVIGPEAVVLECEFTGGLRAGRGAVLHGLAELPGDVEIPENAVVHMIPVRTEDGGGGTVVRVYGVEDNPKATATGSMTWFGRDMLAALAELGLPADSVWPGVSQTEWSLWNALLFPIADTCTAWACARWFLGVGDSFSVEQWAALPRTSLSSGAALADHAALASARMRRAEGAWVATALDLASRGADLRPLLAHPPAMTAVAAGGFRLRETAAAQTSMTDRASLLVHAATFLEKAGLSKESAAANAEAFRCVEGAVGTAEASRPHMSEWRCDEVTVSAPARIDLGGGWSDTPPFCLDWGGTVLNLALELRGEYPISVTFRRIEEPAVRCLAADGSCAEYTVAQEILTSAGPGDIFSIPRTALRLAGLASHEASLMETLAACGGGLEIRSSVHLPVGSGLGTSSILAAATVRALAEMQGRALSDQELADEVMRLEQAMTTGGGWQDQAGGIFPGAKLIMTGPGARQRLRVLPLPWSEARKAEFAGRAVLANTGIQRMAKNLLQQIVRSYLAREASTVQVLHSIKTLAAEMAWAMVEGEWDYLGSLLDRHWELNKVMDPNTTNGPINHLLDRVRPYISGAKLAGAGGGGFLIMIARSPEHAEALKRELGDAVFPFRIAEQGLRVRSLRRD